MKKGKKIVSMILALTLVLTCRWNSVSAENVGSSFVDEYTEYGMNVSSQIPKVNTSPSSVYRETPPGKEGAINLNQNGTLTFSGEADNVALFTNKCFTGISRAMITITNKRSKKLTVRLYDLTIRGHVIPTKTITVPANSTTSTTVTKLNKKKYYYLRFSKPCKFQGNVKRTNI